MGAARRNVPEALVKLGKLTNGTQELDWYLKAGSVDYADGHFNAGRCYEAANVAAIQSRITFGGFDAYLNRDKKYLSKALNARVGRIIVFSLPR